MVQKISPMLWFDTQAEEAAKFYCSVFKNSRMGSISYCGEGMPMPAGTVLVVEFFLDGQQFMALNGGPMVKFNEAISLVVNAENQKELDYYWEKLTSGGGEPIECGWLKDKYGLRWQVVPAHLAKLLSGPGGANVSSAIMKMKKLDIAEMESAAKG